MGTKRHPSLEHLGRAAELGFYRRQRRYRRHGSVAAEDRAEVAAEDRQTPRAPCALDRVWDDR